LYQGTTSQAAEKLDSGIGLYQGTTSQAAEKLIALKGHGFSRAAS
jgi:hypothetical protein